MCNELTACLDRCSIPGTLTTPASTSREETLALVHQLWRLRDCVELNRYRRGSKGGVEGLVEVVWVEEVGALALIVPYRPYPITREPNIYMGLLPYNNL